MIVAKTKLKKIPDNCWDCDYCGCTLPCQSRNMYKMKKSYKTKRHKDCPLVDIKLPEEVHDEK